MNSEDEKMHKMLFNTGVRPWNHCYLSGPNKGKLITGEHEEWHNDQLHIAYYLERKPPENAILQYLAPEPEEGMLNIPIVAGGMQSKYAIFLVVKR